MRISFRYVILSVNAFDINVCGRTLQISVEKAIRIWNGLLR